MQLRDVIDITSISIEYSNTVIVITTGNLVNATQFNTYDIV